MYKSLLILCLVNVFISTCNAEDYDEDGCVIIWAEADAPGNNQTAGGIHAHEGFVSLLEAPVDEGAEPNGGNPGNSADQPPNPQPQAVKSDDGDNSGGQAQSSEGLPETNGIQPDGGFFFQFNRVESKEDEQFKQYWNVVDQGDCKSSNNNEWQCYDPDHVNVKKGENLKITFDRLKHERHQYRSGKITTQGHVSYTYGSIIGRMKLPKGRGLWPALWNLPIDQTYGSWPYSGELDVMEAKGQEPDIVHASLHYQADGKKVLDVKKIKTADLTADFHTYRVDWTPDKISWYFDDNTPIMEVNRNPDPNYYNYKAKDGAKKLNWPFDQKFYMVLNMAVGDGGEFVGDPDPNLDPNNPDSTFEIDYVWVKKG